MFDYEGAYIYAQHRCEELLAEAERRRLLGRPRSQSVIFFVVLPRLVGWTGDLLITTGLRLKALHQLDGTANIEPFLQSTSNIQTE